MMRQVRLYSSKRATTTGLFDDACPKQLQSERMIAAEDEPNG